MSDQQHPALDFDETVHQRARLGILTVLNELAECTFTALRDELSLTDGNLSRHLRILEEAHLVDVHKGYDGRRPCTWLRLTRQGRRALRDEVAALERLVARFHTAPASPGAKPAEPPKPAEPADPGSAS